MAIRDSFQIDKEWGHKRQGSSVASVRVELNDFLNIDAMPLIVVAFSENELLGAAQLKYRQMPMFPEKEHWIGGVYVAPIHRNSGIAESLIREIVVTARRLSVRTLYLQTEVLNGGLYQRMGWKSVEVVNYRSVDVLVMERLLTS